MMYYVIFCDIIMLLLFVQNIYTIETASKHNVIIMLCML
jgi:hypothetical protein